MNKSKGIQPPPYTQVPNLLFDDHLPDMGLAELKVTLVAIRQILGYHKKHPETISINQFIAMTGLSRQGVVDGIAAAMERGILVQAGTGARNAAQYKLNFVDDQSTSLTSDQSTQLTSQSESDNTDQSTSLTSTSLPSRPELVYSVDTQKKVFKENSKEKELPSIPKEGIEAAPPILEPEPMQEELPFSGEPNPDIETEPESVVAASASRGLPVADPHEVDATIYAVGESQPEGVKEKPKRALSVAQQRIENIKRELAIGSYGYKRDSDPNDWPHGRLGKLITWLIGKDETPEQVRQFYIWYTAKKFGPKGEPLSKPRDFDAFKIAYCEYLNSDQRRTDMQIVDNEPIEQWRLDMAARIQEQARKDRGGAVA